MPAPQLGRVAMSMGTETVRVRAGTGAYVDGRWAERGESDVEIRCSVRPQTPSERKLMPEGMRTEDSISLITHGPLKVEQSAVNGAASPDRVLFDGYWWKVVGEKSWKPNGFRRYVAIREAKGRERNL